MRRAFRMAAIALVAITACSASIAPTKVTIVNRINAIGLVDYTRHPTFKVGDYVRYRVHVGGGNNTVTDYLMTILVAGEEEFWGEKCFWLETWTDDIDGRKQTVSSLMSYDIFNDSLADERFQLYRRKLIGGIDENGAPAEEIVRGSANLSSVRSAPTRPFGYKADTLAVDTVLTPLGAFHSRHVEILSGKTATRTEADSTIYLENRETRSRWLDASVPITHVSREDSHQTDGRQAWKLGYSRESGPMIVHDQGFSSARIVEIGHHLKSRLLPSARSTSFAEQAAAKARPAAAHHAGSATKR